LLYHGLSCPRGGYWVCVSMHNLPGAVFGAKGHRDPQIAWRDFLTSANLCIGPLYPENAGKLGCHVLRYGLEVMDLAVSKVRCATLLGLSNPLPPAHRWAKGVGKGHVFSMGEQLLHWPGITFYKLIPRQLKLLEYFFEIIRRSHLEITSTVGTSCNPSIPREDTTLFTNVLERGVLSCPLPATPSRRGPAPLSWRRSGRARAGRRLGGARAAGPLRCLPRARRWPA
jgi:hypothetical protein